MSSVLTKEEILEAIDIAKQKGYEIVAEDWGATTETKKCACALSCVMLVRGHNIPDDIDDVVDALDLPYKWVSNFLNGFDGSTIITDDEATLLGKEIRNEVDIPAYEEEEEEFYEEDEDTGY